MRLVVDTSVLVSEFLRASGRARLGDDRLELFIPERMWAETRVELPRRVATFARRRRLPSSVTDGLVALCFEAVEANVTVLEEAVYAAAEDEALARCRRDPTDWPVVASTQVLSAAVWTNDNDYLGTGVATWTTETLQVWLERN